MGKLGLGLASDENRKGNGRQGAEAESYPVENARAISEPFAENAEIHIDRDPRNYPDQCRGEIVQERDGCHTQRVILQVEGPMTNRGWRWRSSWIAAL